MIRTFFLLALAASAAVVTSCQRALPPVPPSNRTVVGPKGSTDKTTSWNRITESEGNAILGPLSNTRR